MGLKLKIAATTMGLFGIMIMVSSVPNTNITSVLCNSGIYTAGDPFAISLSYIIQEMETNTATRKSYDFFTISPYPNAFAYGHSSCNQNLTSSDCVSCLDAGKNDMLATCHGRIGARAVLRDCSIRYEQYPFTD